MPKEKRLEIIRELERELGSERLICLVTGDRPGLSCPIDHDCIPILHSQLQNRHSSIDLLIYSRGGNLDVPWKIVSILRMFCENFRAIIPYKAHSAATLICLGADSVLMGRRGELSPIDPTMNVETIIRDPKDPKNVSKTKMRVGVEDISSYISLLKKTVGLSPEHGLAEAFNRLPEHINPVLLGNINRTYSRIRMLAGKMLMLGSKRPGWRARKRIVQSLTEKLYAHEHMISRTEAIEDIKLGVEIPSESVEKLLWDLYLQYETDMQLVDPFIPPEILGENRQETIQSRGKYIESTLATDVFQERVVLTRAEPQFNIQLPTSPGMDPGAVQTLVGSIVQQIQSQLRQQMPPGKITVMRTGRWIKE